MLNVNSGEKSVNKKNNC